MDSSNQEDVAESGRRVLAVFEGAPGTELTTEQILERLGWGISDMNRIRCAVHRLIARNDVTRVRPGVYAYANNAPVAGITESRGDSPAACVDPTPDVTETISVRERVLLALQDESCVEMSVSSISAAIAYKDQHYIFQAASKLVATGCGVSSPRPGTFVYTPTDAAEQCISPVGKDVPVTADTPIKPRFDKAHAARTRERVMNVLRSHPGEALSVRTLSREIGSGDVSSVRTAAWIITRENKQVVRIRPGVFVYEEHRASRPEDHPSLTDTGRLIHNAIFDVLRGSDEPVASVDLLDAVCVVVGSRTIRHAISCKVHQLVDRSKIVAVGPSHPSKRTYALPRSA